MAGTSDDTLERRLSGLRVRIDRTCCIGSGSCTRVAPEIFELDSSLLVTFRPDAPEIPTERLVEACGVCPVDALRAVPEDP